MSKGGSCKKKVLFVARVYSHLANFHIPFIRMLAEQGYEIHAAAAPDGHKHRVEGAASHLWDISFPRSLFNSANLKAYQELRKLIKGEGYHLIHVNSPISAFLTRLAARKAKRGSVLYMVHGFHFYRGASPLTWLFYFPLEWLAAFWTDGLVVLNEEDWDTARRLSAVPAKRVFLLPGVGLPLAQFSAPLGPGEREALLAGLGLPPSSRCVLCVAELNRNKNQRQLLQAWPLVLKSVPEAVLLLAGEGADETALRREAKSLGLEDRVRFLGFRGDIPALLQLSEVAALTSQREGLPRAVMEAMAAGRPVVGTDVRGIRDLVEHGRNGFLVPSGNSATVAERLAFLLENPEKAAKMGKAGQVRSRNYDLDSILKEMSVIYNILLTDGEKSF